MSMRSAPRALADLFRATEIDARLVGMLGALALIWIGFDLLSGGAFLTPRNLWNLSVQTASVAVMATGMVLVIVTRHIDLSVGSILGLVGMIMGVTQAEFLPQYLGFDHPLIWVIALAVGLAVGAAIGLLQGADHRLSRRAGLHRDAGRPAGLARLRLVGDLGPHRGADGRCVPAHRRRHRGRDRRELRPGSWRCSPSPPSSGARSTPAGGDGRSALRSGRSGRR